VEYIPEHAKCRGYMVMELVEGDNLWDLVMKKGFFPEEEAQRIFKVIIQALDYMHDNRVVHRDFNPTNVFINTEGQVKILDFNVSKIME